METIFNAQRTKKLGTRINSFTCKIWTLHPRTGLMLATTKIIGGIWSDMVWNAVIYSHLGCGTQTHRDAVSTLSGLQNHRPTDAVHIYSQWVGNQNQFVYMQNLDPTSLNRTHGHYIEDHWRNLGVTWSEML